MLPPDLLDQLGAHRSLAESAERPTRAARRAARRNVGLPAVGLALLIALTGTVVSWGSSQVDDPCTVPGAPAPSCLPLARPVVDPSRPAPEPPVTAPSVPAAPPVTAPPAAPAPAPAPEPAGPAAVDDLYVDPTTAAARQVADWEAQGRTSDVARLRAIADRPMPLWVTGSDDVTEQVDGFVDRASSAGAMPLLVA